MKSPHRFPIALVSVCLALLVSSCVGAAPPEPENDNRQDLHGDRLPPGATARLGTLRLRHDGWVRALVYSSDGSVLASAGRDAVRLWDAESGRERLEITDRYLLPETVVLSPDGKFVATSNGVRLLVWDSRTGRKVAELPSPAEDFAFSPKGEGIAAPQRGQVALWSVPEGREVRSYSAEGVGKGVVAFSPDGKLLAAGGGYPGSGPGRPLLLLDAETGEVVHKLAAPEGGGSTSVKFSPNGELLFAANCVVGRERRDLSAIVVWHVERGRDVNRIARGMTTSGNTAIDISPDGQTLAIGRWRAGKPGRNSLMSLWDVKTRELKQTLVGHDRGTFGVAFSPDGKTLASAGADPVVRRWDVATGEEIVPWDAHEGGVTSVAVSPDGRTVATASSDHTVRLWDPGTGRQKSVLTGHAPFGTVTAVAYSPDGRTLASAAYSDDSVILWNAATNEVRLRLKGHTYGTTSVAFSPDGKKVASGGVDRAVWVWDSANGETLLTLTGHKDRVTAVVFSPDGKLLASGGGGGDDTGNPLDRHTVRIWNAGTGKELHRLVPAARGPVSSLAFSSDGRMLAVASGNGQKRDTASVSLWDPATGEEVRGFWRPPGRDYARAVAFAPGGRVLAAAHSDRTIRFRGVQTGKQLGVIEDGHGGDITSLAFSDDGKRLVSGSADTTALVWEVPNEVTRQDN